MKRIKGIFSAGWKYLRRNPGLVFANIIIVFMTFFITTIFSIIFLGLQLGLKGLEQKIGFQLLFYASVDEQEVLDLKSELEEWNPRLTIEYKSKEQVKEEYRERLVGESGVEFLSDDQYASVLKINSTNLDDVVAVHDRVVNDEEVMAKVRSSTYVEEATGFLKKLTQGVFWGSVGLAGFLLLSSFVIIMITTDVALGNQREEIKTMQLIGADRGYIRWPFIIAGGFCGFMGAFLSVAVVGGGGYFAIKHMVEHGVIEGINQRFSGVTWPTFHIWYLYAVLGGKLLLGWLIGALSSIFAVRRRLKW